jgi:hypothetical protein
MYNYIDICEWFDYYYGGVDDWVAVIRDEFGGMKLGAQCLDIFNELVCAYDLAYEFFSGNFLTDAVESSVSRVCQRSLRLQCDVGLIRIAFFAYGQMSFDSFELLDFPREMLFSGMSFCDRHVVFLKLSLLYLSGCVRVDNYSRMARFVVLDVSLPPLTHSEIVDILSAEIPLSLVDPYGNCFGQALIDEHLKLFKEVGFKGRSEYVSKYCEYLDLFFSTHSEVNEIVAAIGVNSHLIKSLNSSWAYYIPMCKYELYSRIAQCVDDDISYAIEFVRRSHIKGLPYIKYFYDCLDVLVNVGTLHSEGLNNFRCGGKYDGVYDFVLMLKCLSSVRMIGSYFVLKQGIIVDKVSYNSSILSVTNGYCSEKGVSRNVLIDQCLDNLHTRFAVSDLVSGYTDKVFMLTGGYWYADSGEYVLRAALSPDFDGHDPYYIVGCDNLDVNDIKGLYVAWKNLTREQRSIFVELLRALSNADVCADLVKVIFGYYYSGCMSFYRPVVTAWHFPKGCKPLACGNVAAVSDDFVANAVASESSREVDFICDYSRHLNAFGQGFDISNTIVMNDFVNPSPCKSFTCDEKWVNLDKHFKPGMYRRIDGSVFNVDVVSGSIVINGGSKS